MKSVQRILFCGIVLFVGVFTKPIMSLDIVPQNLHPRIVSYEYLTTCPVCGDEKMEGYHSLVDGFTQEICKNCNYHVEYTRGE